MLAFSRRASVPQKLPEFKMSRQPEVHLVDVRSSAWRRRSAVNPVTMRVRKSFGMRALPRVALLVLLLAAPTASAGGIPPHRADGLMDLLVQDCGSCHGLTMKGGLGPALLPAELDGKPNEVLETIILDGVPGTPMPPWRPLLTPDEVAWMVDRLKEGLK
jgi:cytochrome c55X